MSRAGGGPDHVADRRHEARIFVAKVARVGRVDARGRDRGIPVTLSVARGQVVRIESELADQLLVPADDAQQVRELPPGDSGGQDRAVGASDPATNDDMEQRAEMSPHELVLANLFEKLSQSFHAEVRSGLQGSVRRVSDFYILPSYPILGILPSYPPRRLALSGPSTDALPEPVRQFKWVRTIRMTS